MKKPNYKYFVFDGASCHYFTNSFEVVAFFVDEVRRYPKYACIVELHKILDLEAGISRALLNGGDGGDMFE